MKFITNIFISLSVFAFSCTHEENVSDHETATPKSIESNESSSPVAEPKSPLVSTTEAFGHVVVGPNSQVSVYARIGAFVREIRVREGDRVRKGDVLLTLESLDLIEMQQDYQESCVRQDRAATEMERSDALLASRAISDKAYQTAKEGFKLAGIQSVALEKKLTMLGYNPEKLRRGEVDNVLNILSPSDGQMTGVMVTRGERVTEATEMVSFIEANGLYVEARLQADLVTQLQIGQSCTLVRIGNTGKESPGVLEAIIGQADAMNNTVKVRCQVMDKSMTWIPGERVLVRFSQSGETDFVNP